MTKQSTEVLILCEPNGSCYAIPRGVVESYRLPPAGVGEVTGFMKGDFTRLTFDPIRHYQRVVLQQGRVQLDADAHG